MRHWPFTGAHRRVWERDSDSKIFLMFTLIFVFRNSFAVEVDPCRLIFTKGRAYWNFDPVSNSSKDHLKKAPFDKKMTFVFRVMGQRYFGLVYNTGWTKVTIVPTASSPPTSTVSLRRNFYHNLANFSTR